MSDENQIIELVGMLSMILALLFLSGGVGIVVGALFLEDEEDE